MLLNHPLMYAAENTSLNPLTDIWQAACILQTRSGGTDRVQGTESYIGSDQRLDVRLFEKHTREMQDVLLEYLPSFYRRAYRYLDNAADAEDAVQDALLSACRHLGQFKGQAKMSTWLTTIVINSALTKLRRRRRQIHTSLDERLGEDQKYCVSERLADCRPSPEDECVGSDLHGRLLQFVAKLSPSLRKAYQLRVLDGLTTSEAAQIVGVADVTMKAQVSRARAELRRMMRLALAAQPRSNVNCSTSLLVARK
jgi:RNA polymerase sigma-70 factor (ECF subfamily)